MTMLPARLFCIFIFLFTAVPLWAQPAGNEYWVRFPDDTVLYNCNQSGLYGQPVVLGGDSGCIVAQFFDEIFLVIPTVGCAKIERTWQVYDSCHYNPSLPLVYIPNPVPAPGGPVLNPLNFPGPVVSACNATGDWAPTQVPGPVPGSMINYCTYFDSSPNGYEYKQLLYLLDTVPPVLTNCPTTAPVFIDSTANDPNFWNAALTPGAPAGDLVEMPVNFELTGSDGCSGEDLTARFVLFLDLDADGVAETAVTSADANTPGIVRYGNAFNPGYTGGTPIEFDSRPVTTAEKYRFVVRPPVNLRWSTQAAPNTYVIPQLPAGAHHLRWSAEDACGNATVCAYNFTVEPDATSLATAPRRSAPNLRVAPNPATDRATVLLDAALPAGPVTLVVYDALGRVMRRVAGAGNTTELERGGLPAGIYGLRLEAEERPVAVGRVVFW